MAVVLNHASIRVQANVLAMEKDDADYGVFDAGTGRPLTRLDVAHTLSAALQIEITAFVVSKFRGGDIRHCYADVSKARRVLGYEPAIAFEDGITDLVRWASKQKSLDLVDGAAKELAKWGLIK